MKIDNEVWQPIRGYEGLYEASNLGQVRSVERVIFSQRWGGHQLRHSVILKPSISSRGYKMVVLSKNGKRKAYSVHRLVATTFLPNPNNLPVINHKDQNKLNNKINNLEWCDQMYNFHYADADVRRAISQSLAKIGKHYSPRTEFKPGNVLSCNLHPVFCIEKEKKYKSMKEACKECGISRSSILKSCKAGKTIKGLTFKYTTTGF